MNVKQQINELLKHFTIEQRINILNEVMGEYPNPNQGRTDYDFLLNETSLFPMKSTDFKKLLRMYIPEADRKTPTALKRQMGRIVADMARRKKLYITGKASNTFYHLTQP